MPPILAWLRRRASPRHGAGVGVGDGTSGGRNGIQIGNLRGMTGSTGAREASAGVGVTVGIGVTEPVAVTVGVAEVVGVNVGVDVAVGPAATTYEKIVAQPAVRHARQFAQVPLLAKTSSGTPFCIEFQALRM